MIEVSHLSKSYGERKAISDLNFIIEKGEVVGLLGPNGAGKSTTMKIITGFMAPTSGHAKICGYDVYENPLEVKKRIGYLPETPPLYVDMLVQDYLKFVAELKCVPANQIKASIDRALDKTQLSHVRHRLIKNLSKGFKQRVGIAQALVSNPEVLVLDEPTVGLDPKQVAEIRDLIRELKGEHTVILSTHILSEVQATCSKVIIINEGQIVAEDSIEGIEKWNKGTILLNLKTRKPLQQADVLSRVAGVIAVEAITDQHYRIKLEENENLIDQVATAVIQSGAGLLELAPSKANLEEVFLKLTYGQQQERADV
ncbi:ABC transporter ATP-binding protein [Pseudobdellovibrio exovorus]|uniref:ATP-binding protein of ABC transporter n=1 Tax=Pseudobdellovibrio exovorus JSS TaxID=1184267 RepID=M4V9B9_9BACT|nr:ABC transporter ATP-binding protein [Pseudobdellovibrio exovorus]AGH95035.1 ATP-binding protein of ABC transporter [Pseudobdellovibrio exovorus JSS]